MKREMVVSLMLATLIGNSLSASPQSPQDNLQIHLSKALVRWGEPVTLTVSSRNPTPRELQGGITVSFSSNVIAAQKDPEGTVFYEGSTVFKVGHRETVQTREIMVENWYASWPGSARQTLKLVFFPIKTGVLQVKIRAAFILSLTDRSVVNFPRGSSCRDQQGYPAVCLSIYVESSPDFLANLRLIVNSAESEDPEFAQMLQALIDDPNHVEARRYFGIGGTSNSLHYLDRYLQALTDRLKDPSIRDSPQLLTNLKRLINDPMDAEALSFFKVQVVRNDVARQESADLKEACRVFIEGLKGGAVLLSLVQAEGDVELRFSSDRSRIILHHRGRPHQFAKRASVVSEILEKVIQIKPDSQYIREKESLSGYSYLDLRKVLNQ